MRSNLIEGVSDNGIQITYTAFGNPESVAVTDNLCRNTGGVLIDGTGITGNLYGLKFNGNTISESGTAEIRDLIFGATIQGNTFRETALRILDADSSLVSDNRFTNMTLNPAPFSPDVGMLVVSGSDDVTVIGNVCDGENTAATQAFIELTGTMARCYVGLNIYAGQDPGSGSGGVYEEGLRIGASVSSTTLHGNDFAQATTSVNDSGSGTTDQHSLSEMSDVTDWTTWSPTWTNLTVGDGTEAAEYTQIGDLVVARYTLTLGSTSTVGSNPYLTLPVTADAGYIFGRNAAGVGYILDSGTADFQCNPRLRSSTTASFGVLTAGGTYVQFANITSTVPMAWTTNDILAFTLIYQAA